MNGDSQSTPPCREVTVPVAIQIAFRTPDVEIHHPRPVSTHVTSTPTNAPVVAATDGGGHRHREVGVGAEDRGGRALVELGGVKRAVGEAGARARVVELDLVVGGAVGRVPFERRAERTVRCAVHAAGPVSVPRIPSARHAGWRSGVDRWRSVDARVGTAIRTDRGVIEGAVVPTFDRRGAGRTDAGSEVGVFDGRAGAAYAGRVATCDEERGGESEESCVRHGRNLADASHGASERGW